MNGEGLLKRYDVYDRDTGEKVDGALVVRPDHDDYAFTAACLYMRLCGLTDSGMVRAFAKQTMPRVSREAIAHNRNWPVEDYEAFALHADAIDTLAKGHESQNPGTVERVYEVLRGLELEIVSLVCRRRKPAPIEATAEEVTA